MKDKKFIHLTLVLEEQVLKDLRNELGLAMFSGQSAGVRDAFLKKLFATIDAKDWDNGPVRFDYKDSSRGQ